MQFSIEQLIHDKRLPRALTLLIAGLAVIYIVIVAMQWPMPRPPQTVQAVVRIPKLPQIELAHLYGNFVESVDSLPETQLQITLQGVIMLPNTPNKDAAIISSPSQPAKLYHIGDTIPGDAELKRVMMNQVVISNQGELQRLRLPIQTLATVTNDFSDMPQVTTSKSVTDSNQ